jgi:hypothetical protein
MSCVDFLVGLDEIGIGVMAAAGAVAGPLVLRAVPTNPC